MFGWTEDRRKGKKGRKKELRRRTNPCFGGRELRDWNGFPLGHHFFSLPNWKETINKRVIHGVHALLIAKESYTLMIFF